MKLITFSLWGNDPMYTEGAIANCVLAQQLLPDWICRFYVGTSTNKDVINKLKQYSNTEVIEMNTEGTMKSMVWRFIPCSDPKVDVVLSRDADCRFSIREVEAINSWLNSNKDFHIIRDHPYHNAPILGGLWGARNGILKNMNSMLQEFEATNTPDKKQYDQIFLGNVVYNQIKDKAFVNDEFFERKNALKTPRNIDGVYFLGEIFNADGSFYSQEHRDLINRK